MANDYIPGYRPGSEGSTPKMYSVRHLMLTPEASKAQSDLYRATWDAADAHERGEGPPVPCYNNPEPFTGDELMSPREAQATCAVCPVKKLCGTFAELSQPSWGVHSGHVYREEEVE